MLLFYVHTCINDRNDQTNQIHIPSRFGTGYVFPLLHRTLSLAGDAIVAPPDDLHVLQACRLSCALYLAEIRRLFGINGVISTLQTQKLRHYLQSTIGNWENLGLMKIWCLAMGGSTSKQPLVSFHLVRAEQLEDWSLAVK